MSASNKSLLFLLGLVLGLLAGAGFFIFKMDEILKKINVFNSSRDTIVIQQQPVTEEKKSKTSNSNTISGAKKYIGKDTSKSSMTSAELLAKKYSNEIPIRRVIAEADSLLKDSIVSFENHNTEPFIVRKDELLSTQTIMVANLQPADNADTVLEKMSGIKNQKGAITSFKVEFWQSPINYRGYKMSKNKIVLFGIDPNDEIKILHLEEEIFMKKNQTFYKLSFTDEFRQFEKVTDITITSKLK